MNLICVLYSHSLPPKLAHFTLKKYWLLTDLGYNNNRGKSRES
jgi:hypothetical protein